MCTGRSSKEVLQQSSVMTHHQVSIQPAMPLNYSWYLLQSSIHVDILKDNIFAAQQHPRCGNWAAGVMKQYAGLGMPSPFPSSGEREREN